MIFFNADFGAPRFITTDPKPAQPDSAPDSVPDGSQIEQLIARFARGEKSAEAELIEQLYPKLRAIAAMQARHFGTALTLSPTEIVNEAYAAIAKQCGFAFQNREHFLAISAILVRRAILDYLRQRGSRRQVGKLPFLPLDAATEVAADALFDVDWIGVDQAIDALRGESERAAKVVEMKVFAGANHDEIAAALSVSVPTIVRDWRFARAFLIEHMQLDQQENGANSCFAASD